MRFQKTFDFNGCHFFEQNLQTILEYFSQKLQVIEKNLMQVDGAFLEEQTLVRFSK